MKLRTIIFITLISTLLSACVSENNISLDGTSWELSAISKHRPIEGSTVTISFDDGRVSGSSGCNSYGGEYQVMGDKIEIGMLMSTLMACADPAMMDQETQFTQFLGSAQRIEIIDGQLQIFRSDGEALTFVPVKE